MATQVIHGNQSVQIQGVYGSSIKISYGGRAREVPLEPAVVPVGARVQSPARLVRARADVVPYSAREGLLDELEDWLDVTDPFAACLIGGRGGCGKTRLAVELCKRATTRDWLSGLLRGGIDPAALEELIAVPTARLVIVDYAESRPEQLELLLPLLKDRASAEHPVRVLLLVRAGPRRTEDWTEALRGQSEWLDAVVDECDTRVLEDMPLDSSERQALFNAAAGAFAGRVEPPVAPPESPKVLAEQIYSSPLLVVIAAYLAVHGDTPLPSSRAGLLDDLLEHEHRYWRASAVGLFSDDVLPRRVVALATLLNPKDEAAAARLLGLLPNLSDANAERRTSLALWVHKLYPGTGWWNPLEPDLLGEHLVAETFSDQPHVLASLLARENPEESIRPLEVLTRAAIDHPELEAAVQPILSRQFERLCNVAITQAATTTDRELIYGDATVAAAINRAITAIKVDPTVMAAAMNRMPPRPDLILNPLALTLTSQVVDQQRHLTTIHPVAYEPSLAISLNNLSNRLANAGRGAEGLAAIQESVEVYRRLAEANPVAYEPSLATSLNNLCSRLADAGRHAEGLAVAQESVEVRRRLADANPADEPGLAMSLNNLSNRLADAGQHAEGLVAIQESVEVYRRLAEANPADEPSLAMSLNNLSNRLADAGQHPEGLAAIQESVEVYRRLAEATPAAYEPDLALSLNNLSIRLQEVGRHAEGLVAIQESVEVYRRLADANPAAYEPSLARSLNNLTIDLANAGRHTEGLVDVPT